MATRYSVNGNDDDPNVVEGKVVGGRDRDPGEEADPDFLDAIGNIARDFKDLKKKHQQTLVKAYQRSLKKRQAKARRGNPGGSVIKVRRSGILGRPNARDVVRYDAAKSNRDRVILAAELVKEQTGFALSGKQYIMDAMEEVVDMDNDASDEVRPLGQALTEIIAEELPGTFAEGLTMVGELGFQDISLATNPELES